jgi:glycosyltransferase involved in cell wall biosynthesis
VKIAMLGNAAVVHTRRWTEHFRARGHEVRLWSLEPAPASLGAEKLPSARLPGLLRYPLAAPTLAHALARWQPDVVVAHYVPNYGFLGALTRRRPLVVAAWGSDLLRVGSDPLRQWRARHVLTRADLVIADSGNLAAAAHALGAPADRLLALPWGIDLARFALPPGARTPRLLVQTRMHERVYGVETVIEGVAPILAQQADARLVIAGDGHRRGPLERHAARLLPAGHFAFVGKLEPQALARLLQLADVYLSASRSDSTSVSLLEAMACGALPVVSDIDGNREWVADGEGARLFRAGDPADLTRALRAALSDPAWAQATRAANRRVVEARADWTANMAQVEARLDALASARAPRGARGVAGAAKERA